MYKVYHGTNTLGTIETKPMLHDLLEIDGSYYKVILLPQGRKRGINVVPWSEITGEHKNSSEVRNNPLKIEFKAYDTINKEWIDKEKLVFFCGTWIECHYGLTDYSVLDVDSGAIVIYQKDKFGRWNKVK